ncbi:MAG: amidohydrolase family protein [Promethearchaeota archaeon]
MNLKYILQNGNIVYEDKIIQDSIEILNGKIHKIYNFDDSINSNINNKENKVNNDNVVVINCKDKFILPGIIDLHVHLRDMEQSYKETIDSATKTALYNGITTVFAMPNTVPKLSTADLIQKYSSLIKQKAWCNVGLYGGIGNGFNIEELVKMKNLGIFGLKIYPGDSSNIFPLDWNIILNFEKKINGFFDEENIDINKLIEDFNQFFSTKNTKIYFEKKCKNWFILLNKLANLNLILLIHPDIPIEKKIRKQYFEGLLKQGMTELKAHSYTFSKLHELLNVLFFYSLIKYTFENYIFNSGINETKDNKLNETTLNIDLKHKLKVHFCHISCSESINLIKKLFSEKKYIEIAIETTPHHLFLNYENPSEFPTYSKVLQPLRSPLDMKNLQKQLKLSKISFLATDHAPHTIEEKKKDFFSAPSGFPELDTYSLYFLSNILNNSSQICNLIDFVKLASLNPAKWIGITNKGAIKEGYDADLLIIEKTPSYSLHVSKFLSKSKLTPYNIKNLQCKIFEVFIKGLPIKRAIANEDNNKNSEFNQSRTNYFLTQK